jgi:hypothetical protein
MLAFAYIFPVPHASIGRVSLRKSPIGGLFELTGEITNTEMARWLPGTRLDRPVPIYLPQFDLDRPFSCIEEALSSFG